MKTLSKDARGFIEEVASFVRSDARAKSAIPRVQSLITKVTASARKEENAQVKSAVVLTPGEKNHVETLLTKLLGHAVTCHYSVDTSIVGGIKIQVADWIVDSSLTSQLTDIAHSITNV
jgi:F-type H+-transporting ATPase subunit delta